MSKVTTREESGISKKEVQVRLSFFHTNAGDTGLYKCLSRVFLKFIAGEGEMEVHKETE